MKKGLAGALISATVLATALIVINGLSPVTTLGCAIGGAVCGAVGAWMDS